MPAVPTRIELLELDIDLRLLGLWSEAGLVEEWNLETVAAFIRAAYGKGYCDALVEGNTGELCQDHGYRLPQPLPLMERAPSRELCRWPAWHW